MSRAPDALLGELHLKLAERMLSRLESGEELTAAEWNAISAFLKNNGIGATPAQNPALAELAKATIPDFDDDEAWDGTAAH